MKEYFFPMGILFKYFRLRNSNSLIYKTNKLNKCTRGEYVNRYTILNKLSFCQVVLNSHMGI